MQRQDIIDALKLQLQNILTTNGYETNVGAKVLSNYSFDFSDDELPLVNIVEDPEGSDVPQISGGEWLHNCPVRLDIIDVITAGDSEDTIEVINERAAENMRKNVNDVLRAIGEDKTIGGTCEDIEISKISIGLLPLEKNYSTGTIEMNLLYITDEWRI